MNIENICRFKKVLDRYFRSSRTKSFIKLNFRFMGRFQKNAKKIISDTPKLSMSI